MDGIDIPLVVADGATQRQYLARVDAQVNLPGSRAKGLHMSRNYNIVDALNLEVGSSERFRLGRY